MFGRRKRRALEYADPYADRPPPPPYYYHHPHHPYPHPIGGPSLFRIEELVLIVGSAFLLSVVFTGAVLYATGFFSTATATTEKEETTAMTTTTTTSEEPSVARSREEKQDEDKNDGTPRAHGTTAPTTPDRLSSLRRLRSSLFGPEIAVDPRTPTFASIGTNNESNSDRRDRNNDNGRAVAKDVARKNVDENVEESRSVASLKSSKRKKQTSNGTTATADTATVMSEITISSPSDPCDIVGATTTTKSVVPTSRTVEEDDQRPLLSQSDSFASGKSLSFATATSTDANSVVAHSISSSNSSAKPRKTTSTRAKRTSSSSFTPSVARSTASSKSRETATSTRSRLSSPLLSGTSSLLRCQRSRSHQPKSSSKKNQARRPITKSEDAFSTPITSNRPHDDKENNGCFVAAAPATPSANDDVVSLRTSLQESCSRCSVLEQRLRDVHLRHEAEQRALVERHEAETTSLRAERRATLAETTKVVAHANETIARNARETNRLREELATEIAVWRGRNAGKELPPTDDETDPAVARVRSEAREARVASLEAELVTAERARRVLHDRVRELRGNVRVYARLRPSLENNAAVDDAVDVLGERVIVRFARDAVDDASTKHADDHEFSFDKVFGPATTQAAVFDEVSDLVTSALDGFDVCLFSYGQTGSGKTHTMQGGSGDMQGVIPRAVERLLEGLDARSSSQKRLRAEVDYLEIYNEELRDLLLDVDDDNKRRPPRLVVRCAEDGARDRVLVEGLTTVAVDGIADRALVDGVLDAAARARSVASTSGNARSSRGHAVFRTRLFDAVAGNGRRNSNSSSSGGRSRGSLSLVDLAGSERLDAFSQTDDEETARTRARETRAINKSLSALGDVFRALADGSSHVPYRNSKLTWLLRDSLSGDGKALMFVNLGPERSSAHESLCSLRFARRVSRVELGRPVKRNG